MALHDWSRIVAEPPSGPGRILDPRGTLAASMSFYPRLALQLGLALAAPAALGWLVLVWFFPIAQELRWPLLASLPVGVIVLDAIALAVLRPLCAPLRQALMAPRPDQRLVARAAAAGYRLPSYLATILFPLTGAVVAGLATLARSKGAPEDLVAAGAAVGGAVSVLVSTVAFAVAGPAVALALERLGPSHGFRGKGTVSGKIVSLGFGLLTSAVLLFASAAYVVFRQDAEAGYLERAEHMQEAALVASREAPPAALAQLVWHASGAATVLLGRDGALLARAGPDLPAPAPAEAGPPVRRVADGWMLRRALPAGTLVSFLPAEPLEARRAAFLRPLLQLSAMLYLAVALLVWLTVRTVSVPLDYLGRAADRIASGDLTASPASLARDEMGQLASDFRRMSRGLTGLVGEVQEATQGVSRAVHELREIGERVRRGALDQHAGMVAAGAAGQSMEGSIGLVAKGMDGLSEYVSSTATAVEEMARALEEVRRQGAELDKAMASAMGEADGLAGAGRKAQAALQALDAAAGGTARSMSALNASISGLELAAVAGQLNAAQAAELAEHASEVVKETVKGIENARTAVGDAQRRVTNLDHRAGDIDQIVDFIADVAGRTNLLSLNASIIAAQAGEHGKPFAVVAEQIRELAAQIAGSTKSIGDIIRAVRDEIQGTAALIGRGDALAAAGLKLGQRSMEALEQILTATAQGHQNASSIQTAVQEHVRSGREVTQLVGSVAEGTGAVRQAIELVGGSVAALEALQRTVGNMADRVNRALAEQSGLGKQQLQSLARIDAMIAEITRAVADHGEATRRMHASLTDLGRAAEQHEAAVGELSAVAERMAGHARALSERVGRFRVG